jgi:hypothetical protein
MKTLKTLLVAGLLSALAVGCSTTGQKQNALTHAGFQRTPANTPDKQAYLKSLPAGQFTPIQRDGLVFYTFPDPQNNLLYVGQQTEYDKYQQLIVEQELKSPQYTAAQINRLNAGWGVWEGWR